MRNAGTNNADLPPSMQPVTGGAMPTDASVLDEALAMSTDSVAASHSILIAPTEHHRPRRSSCSRARTASAPLRCRDSHRP